MSAAVIAKESYQYYKCMRKIIRSENGGDLTYFVQYYLELLVRAPDARNERKRKREQEALEREQQTLEQERELARQPLKMTVEAATPSSKLPESTVPAVDDKSGDESSFEPDFPVPENIEEYLAIVDKIQKSPHTKVPSALDRIRAMFHSGMEWFTVSQWENYPKLNSRMHFKD